MFLGSPEKSPSSLVQVESASGQLASTQVANRYGRYLGVQILFDLDSNLRLGYS